MKIVRLLQNIIELKFAAQFVMIHWKNGKNETHLKTTTRLFRQGLVQVSRDFKIPTRKVCRSNSTEISYKTFSFLLTAKP